MSGVSFTGGNSVRHPAPDVARGFMLLLIALANVSFWAFLFPVRAEVTAVDALWVSVRSALISERSYPLFAILFGFGLATMARRRIEANLQGAHEGGDVGLAAASQDRVSPEMPHAHVVGAEDAAAREAATVGARRLLRRRGLWMLLFGAVHGLAFMGDIIGAYALIATVFAGTIVRRKHVRMAVVGGLLALVCVGYRVYLGWSISQGAVTVGSPEAATQGAVGAVMETLRSPAYPLLSLGVWTLGLLFMVVGSMASPAVLLGVCLAETDLLTRPDRHRRALVVGGAAALAVGALGAVPGVLVSGTADLPTWLVIAAFPLGLVTGIVGACGWLALLAAWAGPGGAPLRGTRWLLAAVGRRSMTAYVGQTVLFGLIFGVLSIMGERAPHQATMALLAVAVWAVLAGLCAWMERSGHQRGPLEVALRRAVASSARRRP